MLRLVEKAGGKKEAAGSSGRAPKGAVVGPTAR